MSVYFNSLEVQFPYFSKNDSTSFYTTFNYWLKYTGLIDVKDHPPFIVLYHACSVLHMLCIYVKRMRKNCTRSKALVSKTNHLNSSMQPSNGLSQLPSFSQTCNNCFSNVSTHLFIQT